MRTGDACVCGSGVMHTYKTDTRGMWRTRYLKCNSGDCGKTGKEVLSVDARGRPNGSTSAGTNTNFCSNCGGTIEASQDPSFHGRK